MKIANDKTDETRFYSRRITFEGADSMSVPEWHHSHKGKSFIPTHVTTRWDHGSTPDRITLHGLIVKKDGTPGSQDIALKYDLSGKSYYFHTPPEWIQELFK